MGGWVLEVGKMVLYISFPVAMFHYFNQPKYFEKWVIQKRREIYPPDDPEKTRQLEELFEHMRQKRDEEMMKALDEFEGKQQNK